VKYIALFLCHVSTFQFWNYSLALIFITFLGFVAKQEIWLCSYYRVLIQVSCVLSEALFVSMGFSNKELERILRLSCVFHWYLRKGRKTKQNCIADIRNILLLISFLSN